MIIGIVGSEAAKFTPESEKRARETLRVVINHAEKVVSGACHLGGIDKWAIEEAQAMGVPTQEYPPAKLSWEGGYKQRNLQIARESDVLVCITVQEYPEGYTGMRFQLCYHCGTNDHIKSGGCWTMKQAAMMGKRTRLLIV